MTIALTNSTDERHHCAAMTPVQVLAHSDEQWSLEVAAGLVLAAFAEYKQHKQRQAAAQPQVTVRADTSAQARHRMHSRLEYSAQR